MPPLDGASRASTPSGATCGPNVLVRTIFSKHVREVPQLADPNQVTLLEEDKISAYYAGGNLYASAERLEPQI